MRRMSGFAPNRSGFSSRTERKADVIAAYKRQQKEKETEMSRITRNITDLGKETITPPAPDAPRALNGATWHLSLTIWDVHAGDLGAEIVAQTDSPESCYTLGACLERVAELIAEIHPDASHAASREKISARQQSHRVQMSKTSGNTTFRVRYVADGRDMLATADIRRA